MTGFRKPSEGEKEEILFRLTRERRSNIAWPLGCLIAVAAGTAALTIGTLITGNFHPEMIIFLCVLMLPTLFFTIKNTMTENEKIRRIKDGDALIADAVVKSVGRMRLAPRTVQDVAEVEFADGDNLRSRTFVISKRIRKYVESGSRGYVIRYSESSNRWLGDVPLFVPRK